MSIIYKLGSLVNIYKGSTLITKKYIDENQGIYPVISSKTTENGIYGFINRYDYEKNKITMSLIGENAGTFFWQEKNFSLTNNACVFISNKNINYNYKYLFITLKKHEYKIKEFIVIGSARPMISSNHLKLVDVNLPSIEIQDAIISIIEPLEKSIKTINLLQTKIGLFIEKTFNFINNNLANADLIEFSLKDLLNIKRGLPITEKDLLNNPGNYPLISASSKNNGIFGYFNDYMYDGKNITISMNGNAGCIFYQIGKFSANSDVLVLSNSNKNLTNIDYIYYLLKTKEKEIQNLAIGTTRFRLGNSVIEKFKVLLPNMEIQKEFSKIVEPLLNLSTKVNKIEKNLNECLLKIVKKLII
ncbi:restriction-modification enzyme MpuUVI S subunit [Ureaplasma urealyticum serovar 13 str. ATCC 33698]|uniref:restriction endonuclease subunit S n=1 Tax=Ureaplasma urealyticum TaxID=2130 RepID=UPI00017220A6|nr:restriction endonuclease subunit S [Ureaplasma urealyticum]EDT49620.1 restriction-modification enzyme MpuUVI S subunit [Ureaplasma urealyticum serovar 13 str. ATCC 33698]